MKRNEIQNELKKLGFKKLCTDNKTLVAYNLIQFFLKSNHTPIKAITKTYLDKKNDNMLRIILYNNKFNDFEIEPFKMIED